MKFFINDAQDVVNEGIDGLLTDPNLTRLDNFPEVKVVLQKELDKNKVAVISGGGSGHEPAHAGFVGKGMLTAAVCGDIFASPSVDAVLSAIIATAGEKGCLLIIKNYTGDRLNFGLAAEQARELGYKVETVIVGDDIALGQEVEQRGLAGTVFVHKVAGHLAEKGKSLDEIAKTAQKVANNIFSIGLSLEEGKKFQNPESSRLSSSEAELGLGIHGEPGVKTIDMEKADDLMSKAVEKLKEYLPKKNNEKFVLLMNNLGRVTPIEMNILLNSFQKLEIARQVEYIIGPSQLMTSLNMSGFSISLLKLNEGLRDSLTSEVEPVSWSIRKFGENSSIESPDLPDTMPFKPSENMQFKNAIKAVAEELISLENDLNAIDEKVGDGDAGSTFATAGKKLLEVADKLPYANTAELLITIGRILAREIGGSSGVLLSIMFTGAGNSYKEESNIGKALMSGLQKMKDYGGAKEGDRTMIDALQPAFSALENGKKIDVVAKKARQGADSTKEISSTKFGRSSYLSEESLKGIPDPGAEAVAIVFEKLASL
ncbi:dihydroxyacetone kinase [Salegentibacter salinarum]|uniref:Dihydroxyacetone kinase n=1 Tax=Salegentibacter salinarum TaxID=447422 RepID=A0A2N0TZ15_9FLAO|nr:dihydroxyacetone kinase subunit DhaK [Salegentibacter salinarum]PKD19992.1 dihydroxyacetone kinase [Salegentibacter salinarum]SKB97121.1 dihydroxyacetone kinase [Salegentibacter salinarum]